MTSSIFDILHSERSALEQLCTVVLTDIAKGEPEQQSRTTQMDVSCSRISLGWFEERTHRKTIHFEGFISETNLLVLALLAACVERLIFVGLSRIRKDFGVMAQSCSA